MLQISPTPLALSGAGAKYALPLTASEMGYAGQLTESDTCAGVATIAPGTGLGPMLMETVTGIAAGTCTVTFTDSFAQHASVTVTVTTVGVNPNTHRHRKAVHVRS